jgi:peptide/nickel transport system substrate-binding protein
MLNAIKPGRRKVLSLVGVAFLLAGCGAANTAGPAAPSAGTLPSGVTVTASGAQALSLGEPKSGGSLTVGMIAPVESLDPTSSVSSARSAMNAIFDVLFVYDEKGNVIPELAKSIETGDKGATWTLKLPTGVKFTDGTDFNADAVVKHLKNLAAEGSMSRSAGDVRQIEKMVAVDDATVKFTLKAPNMVFPKIFVWGQPGGPSMIPSPTAVEKLGKDFGAHPVGVGPFKVKSFKAGGDIVLERNPDYRIKGQPYLDELKFVTATDTQTRLAAAVAGDIDLASTQSGVDLAQATEGGLTSLYQPDGTFYDVLFNLTKAPFDDVRFRQAVIQAIDNNGLNQAAFEGKQTPMTGIFPSSNPFYAETAWPAFDPEAAKKLVAEYVADGGKAEFAMTTTSPPEFQKQAQVMQQMLQDVGITVTLNVSDQPTMVTEALSGNYQSQLRFAEVREEIDQQLRQFFHSTSTGNNGKAGDPEVDALLDELRTPEGQERKAEIYAELQNRFAEWLPIAPLVAHKNGWYVGKDVGGFPGARVGLPDPDWRLLWATQN